MAEERFEDKTLHKKDDAKMKGEKAEAAPAEAEEKAKDAPKKDAVKAEKKTESQKTEKESKKNEKPEEKKPTFVLERKYTVNLTDAYAKPRFFRANRAIHILQDFAKRHMKAKDVHIDVALNNTVRKSAAPLKKVHVLLQKDADGTVFATLAANQ
ncbi:MAG: hypothetical protein Q8P02_01870 [Candidatus Micrarchaeota archaeon]|nr:hypothetical protein [Candidatus Micrarchaeota archaeon]